MSMKLSLCDHWKILQDVHDTGERLELFRSDCAAQTTIGAQLSEWEELPRLRHLQLEHANQPYFGRELRYFNQAPWWYRRDFDVPAEVGKHGVLRFSNVDYYCRVWLNGALLGEHEGYMNAFSFDIDGLFVPGERNTLIVKVWSPWDDAVDGDLQENRTARVLRNMVKGTYEHSDTFVQRDVNPVGIYGEVSVTFTADACLKGRPEVSYTLEGNRAALTVKTELRYTEEQPYTLRLICTDSLTRKVVCREVIPVTGDGEATVSATVEDIRLWSTWDHGGPWLYDITVELFRDGVMLDRYTEVTGFRTIELDRDAGHTVFRLNGKPIYIRGTSYFPDVYVSAMSRERYKRDLLAIRTAGFNLVRVHVHVERDVFYELCTELGIAVIQDSEYNWMHPVDDAFAARFIGVFLETVDQLKRHPSIFCWICMNEPTIDDPADPLSSRTMAVNPGPALYKAVRERDPNRPAIKGSFVEVDPDSGDSHNYTGSLAGDDIHYSEIFGTVEKFNTEYGFDAPPCADSLERVSCIRRRLAPVADRLDEIQYYQYALLKYYTEHYRMQKYKPNAGYVQFLFNDLCPQSFYGLYDWWGLPKPGLDAMLESNQPVGVFLRYNRDRADAVFAVNDGDEALGDCTVRWIVTEADGAVQTEGECPLKLDTDSIAKAEGFCALKARPGLHVALALSRGSDILAVNHYDDPFTMPTHVKGHPSRMSHELGMRIYGA